MIYFNIIQVCYITVELVRKHIDVFKFVLGAFVGGHRVDIF